MSDQITDTLKVQPMNVQQAIDAAKAMGIDQLDAQLLLLFALGRTSRERAWLLAHDKDLLLQDEQNQYMALLQRRAIGVPVAYLTGEKEFYGRRFSVDKRVLIPRPDTETLVDWAKGLLPAQDGMSDSPIKVLDLGTGSGILAIILKSLLPQTLDVTAVDVSTDALHVAALNASEVLPAQQNIRFLQGSWFEAVADEKFDLIVSNPPYIAQEDPHLDALSHEPHSALVSGVDGLDDIRVIIGSAKRYLSPGGWILIEHGYDQAQAVQALFTKAGFTEVQTRQDLGSNDRVTGGCVALTGE